MVQIGSLLQKEFKSDFRNPYAFVGAVLFLVSSLFVCYITIKRIQVVSTWVALYWIVVLFTSFNAVAKSFVNETRGRLLYFYTLHSPTNFVISKMVYNALLMITLSGIAQIIYGVFFDLVVQNPTMLWVGIVLGSTGISFILSTLSSIAARAGSNMTLLAILGLPILLPIMLVATRFTKNAIDGIDWSIQWKYLFVLIGLNVVCFLLSVILFPYLWKE
ncbi:MAG: hypothetical protein Salg2KO_07150 [Salibacteraceae bacterium]